MLIISNLNQVIAQNCVPLKAEDFQKLVKGKPTNLYFLENINISAAITNYGGRIVNLCVPDKNGDMANVVLGFKNIDEYLNTKEIYHGALIGRVGNRIAKGKFMLDGVEYTLPLNNKTNHLHGGPDGFHNVVWDVKCVTDSSIILNYLSKDGEMGYPGNLNVEVKYTLTSKKEMIIEYQAITDKATPVNLTNHAFFNLAGEKGGSINNHLLIINADKYTPIDSTLIPLKENVPVTGTPFDFRKAKPIGQDLLLQTENRQLKYSSGYDHNFELNKTVPGRLEFAASVCDPVSGRKMIVYTKEPGLQLYGGNFKDLPQILPLDKDFKYRRSFTLETQHFPDSPNHPNFPSVILRPGEIYSTSTIYQFVIEK